MPVPSAPLDWEAATELSAREARALVVYLSAELRALRRVLDDTPTLVDTPRQQGLRSP